MSSNKYLSAKEAIRYIKDHPNAGAFVVVACSGDDSESEKSSFSQKAEDEFGNIYTHAKKEDRNVERALELIDRIDIDCGETGWHLRNAAQWGDRSIVKALIERGARSGINDALRWARVNDDLPSALLLLDVGAKVPGPYVCGHAEWLQFAKAHTSELGKYATMKLWK